ncbi:hypothetical protein CSW57_04000 [Williamsia muralis]|uniref:Uncharacterized protein n=1 Tax=Williamsia marianensis TaxID=85044 RepID=A0A2G3PRI9_WILMA|nr:hypothetical protein CSW57_04000 [Williamsia marianensis]
MERIALELISIGMRHIDLSARTQNCRREVLIGVIGCLQNRVDFRLEGADLQYFLVGIALNLAYSPASHVRSIADVLGNVPVTRNQQRPFCCFQSGGLEPTLYALNFGLCYVDCSSNVRRLHHQFTDIDPHAVQRTGGSNRRFTAPTLKAANVVERIVESNAFIVNPLTPIKYLA